MSFMRERILQTANSFITSFNEFTPESVIAHRSPICLHDLQPSSLKSSPRTNAEYSAWVKGLKSVMRNFKMHPKEGQPPIVDEVARQVVLCLTSTAESDLGPYENEYICVLTLNEDGTLIDRIVEFADSAYTIGWIKALEEAAQSKGQD